MSQQPCPVTGLPVQFHPELSIYHPEPAYQVVFETVGTDIVHIRVVADRGTYLDFIDFEQFNAICRELGAYQSKNIFVVIDYEPIREVRLRYKEDFTNLFYNWGPWISLLLVYNVHPDIRIDMLGLGTLCPSKSQAMIVESYQEAMAHIAHYKSHPDPFSRKPSRPQDAEQEVIGQFLHATARLTWLDMLDQPVEIPLNAGEYRPFFEALEGIRRDLAQKELRYGARLEAVRGEHAKKAERLTVQTAMKVEQYRQTLAQYEKELLALQADLASRDEELGRVSQLFNTKLSSLSSLCDTISHSGLEPEIEARLHEACRNISLQTMAGRDFGGDLTEADTAFLSLLQDRHPALSERERRISLFIRLNYPSRDIARRMGLSVRGLESIRYRLHKKLGLEKHQSLKSYFSLLEVGGQGSAAVEG